MTTPLLAKLRGQYPSAEIVMAMPPAYVALYSGSPFGARALPFSPRDGASIDALLNEAPFDLAFIPGDNRFSWLARAMGARWIVAWAGDEPAYKNWPVDEHIALPTEAGALGDLWAALQPGPPPAVYEAMRWPAPPCSPFEKPAAPYVVLHVGASNEKKLWPSANWRVLAAELAAQGLTVVWSAGRGEEALVQACDAEQRHASYAGRLDLAQLWHLLRDAALIVAPDTGVAHLAKVTGTPTLALFGPGPTALYARGGFWAGMPFVPVVLDDLPPRFQATLFRRSLPWLHEAGKRPSPEAIRGSGILPVRTAAQAALGAGRASIGTRL